VEAGPLEIKISELFSEDANYKSPDEALSDEQ